MLSQLHLRNPKYGWIPDLPDQRDLLYFKVAPITKKLPAKIDLRNFCTPIEDQGELGSCTAHALTGNLEFLQKKDHQVEVNFSRLFLYYNERLIRRDVNSDSGASLRDGIKSLVRVGDCMEDLWPYVIDEFAVKPPKTAYVDASLHQITSYYRILATIEMKHTLSLGFPFVFGFAVYDSFESEEVTASGIVPMPGPNERMLGGHAVLAVGYDDTKRYFILKNSWGANWGDHGYFYLPYEYLADKNLSSDFWTIRNVEDQF